LKKKNQNVSNLNGVKAEKKSKERTSAGRSERERGKGGEAQMRGKKEVGTRKG